MAKRCNEENMAEFVFALRSGEYEQGTGTLRRDGKFCCLGVACETAIRHGVEVEVKNYELGGCGIPGCASCQVEKRWVYDGASSYLPAKVAEWLGIDSGNPVLAGRTATWWNDASETSFEGIAQLFSSEYLSGDVPDDAPEWEKEFALAGE